MGGSTVKKAHVDEAIAQTVNIIIEYGVRAGASDIHIEPRADAVVVRYRIDGLLREANKLPSNVLQALAGHIKTLSKMETGQSRSPQDGRFKMEVGGTAYDLSVSTLPVLDGEKVVMRILDESSKPPSFRQLGFWGTALANLRAAITEPYGLVLVVGPYNSGKSTTLSSITSSLDGSNVDLAGEILDSKTAKTVVKAARTGHLVFGAMHTASASDCPSRLAAMGAEPLTVASTMRAIIAQRLVRRLCEKCRQPFKPDAASVKRITETLGVDDSGGLKRLHVLEAAALHDGLGQSSAAKSSTTTTTITRLWKASEDGCDNCHGTGYKGRIGLYEVLRNSSAIQRLIVNGGTSQAIEQTAVSEDMLTMRLDGLIKALRGLTTVEEVLRVT